MSVAARLFILISEIGFFIFMVIVPGAYSGWLLSQGNFPAEGLPLVWFVAGLIGYWFTIICLFGAVALMAENNKSLKNIEELLEKQNSIKEAPSFSNSGPSINARAEPRFKAE